MLQTRNKVLSLRDHNESNGWPARGALVHMLKRRYTELINHPREYRNSTQCDTDLQMPKLQHFTQPTPKFNRTQQKLLFLLFLSE